MSAIRVASIDNHEVVREGIMARLARVEGFEVVGAAADVPELVELIAQGAEPDVVLLDLWLDDGLSISAIPDLTAHGTKVLLYTTEQRPALLREAVEAGAAGLLLKRDGLETLVDGIRAAAAEEFYCSSPLADALLHDPTAMPNLSPRQIEILEGLAEGLDYRGIAALLGSTESSVKTHLARIRERFRAIGVEPGNAQDLTRLAAEAGYLHRPAGQ